jgi:dienelactone hydrolase
MIACLRLAIATLLLHAAAALAQPASLYSMTTETTELARERVKVDIYRPEDFGSAGLAILAHGFTRDRLRDRDLGRALATAGVIAVAPDLPNVVDPFGNAEAVTDLVRDLERGAFGLPPTPRSRIVLIGTSAGGLSTLLAAANLPGLAGWIGLDPVDGSGVGIAAAKKVTAPAVVLLADPSVCNLFGSGKSIAEAMPGLVRFERMRGASHCDFEGPTNSFCRTVCGRSPAGAAETVRRETVNAALTMLDTGESPPATPEAPEASGADGMAPPISPPTPSVPQPDEPDTSR